MATGLAELRVRGQEVGKAPYRAEHTLRGARIPFMDVVQNGLEITKRGFGVVKPPQSDQPYRAARRA